jgi:hypothetical protein
MQHIDEFGHSRNHLRLEHGPNRHCHYWLFKVSMARFMLAKMLGHASSGFQRVNISCELSAKFMLNNKKKLA